MVGQRRRELLLAQLSLRVSTAPVVERHDAAVVVGELVGAHSERVREWPREAHQEATPLTATWRRLCQRRVGTLLAVVPALGRQLASLEGEDACAAQRWYDSEQG